MIMRFSMVAVLFVSLSLQMMGAVVVSGHHPVFLCGGTSHDLHVQEAFPDDGEGDGTVHAADCRFCSRTGPSTAILSSIGTLATSACERVSSDAPDVAATDSAASFRSPRAPPHS